MLISYCRDIFSYILKQFSEYIVSLIRFLKRFYCSLTWVSLLSQRCRLQVVVFLQFPVQFENCYHLPIQVDHFVKNPLGWKISQKIILYFVKWNFICPLLKKFPHHSEKFRIFSHCCCCYRFYPVPLPSVSWYHIQFHRQKMPRLLFLVPDTTSGYIIYVLRYGLFSHQLGDRNTNFWKILSQIEELLQPLELESKV